MEKLHRIPFFRLLMPLLAGIVIQYYLYINFWSIIPLLLGLVIMLLSYFINPRKQHKFRWLFGCGLFLFLFSTGIFTTFLRQLNTAFIFPEINQAYKCTVIDIPQKKAATIAYKVELEDSNKKIVCYIPIDSLNPILDIGDKFVFFSQIERFKSLGNPGEFDYAAYMFNRGYAGYTFVRTGRWNKTEDISSNIGLVGIKVRQCILHFYDSLQLSNDEKAILSALTLGYKDTLSDDLKQSFQSTGTSHILAVSGMHVGIIYGIIVFLLNLLPKRLSGKVFVGISTICLLWIYVFVIGFPASAVRASLMLTSFCVAGIFGMKNYSLNTLFATAFLMLIWNPFQLFDLGFQLSFAAVLSMIILLPLFNGRIYVENRLIRYFFNILIVSLAAQIGTFPLCLYYFGTFPTYFFLANLLVIPLVGLLMCNGILILIAGSLSYYLLYLPVQLYKIFIEALTRIIHFFESLPYAQVTGLQISFMGIFIIWMLIGGFFYFIVRRSSKALIVSLLCVLFIIIQGIYNFDKNRDSLIVFNRPRNIHLNYQLGFTKYEIERIDRNVLLRLKSKSYLILKEDCWKESVSKEKYDVDYLHLTGNSGLSLYSLNKKFNISKVILDSSLSARNLKRFVLECEKLRIPYYDVSENGALRINFY